jgi:drug/metabolite transporter (DMT)-like permease
LVRLPHPVISHHRREPAREVSTNRRVQGGSAHSRMRAASGPPSSVTAARVLGVATLAIEHPHVSRPLPLAGALAWLVLVNSIGTFTLMYAMLRRRSASQVSSLFFLTPAVTAILAYVFLGQALGWLTIAGLMVSGAGVILAARGPRGAASLPRDQARAPQRSPAAATGRAR